MDPGLLRDALTLVVGVAAGVLSAAFGVGGAVVTTPAVRALGLSAELAVGTTLPSILPSALSGGIRYSREGLVDWRVVWLTVPAGIAASVGGSVLAHALPGEGHLLMVATALLLGLTAARMARPPTSAPRDDSEDARDTQQVRPALLVGVGAAAGLTSGLLGIGGGVVMVPGFTEIAKVPLKTAIASSLVCVGMFAVPGTITHAVLGGIAWWPWAVMLAIGVVPGARLGAYAAIRATDVRLRRAVAVFLGLIAVVYLAGEVAALVGG